MKHHNFVSYQFVIILFFVILILIIPLAKGENRPTSSITSTDPYWFRTDDSEGSIEIEWEVNDPNDVDIAWMYFWACYYYDVVESCDGTEKDNWTYIQRHAIVTDDPKVEVISIDDLIAKVGDEEGYYKLITCAVNEDGIAEYGEEDASSSNGCSFRYQTQNHNTYFDSSKMEEFGFDDSAPEIIIEIEPYSNGPEMISYNLTDLAGIKSFTLQYKEPGAAAWTEIKDEDVDCEYDSEKDEETCTYQFRYKYETTCTGCGEGNYSLRIKSTDILEHESPWTNTNSIYDTVIPLLKDFNVTEDGDDGRLEVDDVVAIEWDGYDNVTSIESESVQIWYCLWDNITSEDYLTLKWIGDQEYAGNTTHLTVSNGMPEGLYYFYPRLVDEAGNPSAQKDCKVDKSFSLDKSKPEANIYPENGKFVNNIDEVEITITVSDNIELGDVVLRYSHDSDSLNLIQNRTYSFNDIVISSTTEVFNFPEGPGTYHFFLAVDDQHPFTSTTEATMTLIYDIEAPESVIVFEGEGPDVTNLDKYSIYCDATDIDSEVTGIKLYSRYKSNELDDSEIWNFVGASVFSSEICKIDFDFFDGDGFYEFYVEATDEAGNEENKEANSELTIIKDSKEPDFELLSIISEGSNFISLNSNTVYYKNLSSNIEIRFIGTLSDELSGINETIDHNNLNWSWDSNIWSIDFTYNISQSDTENNVPLTVFDLAGNPSQIIINFEEDKTAPLFFLYNTILDEMLSDEGTLLIRSGITEISIVEVPGNGAAIALCEVKWETDWVTLDGCNFKILEGKTVVSIRITDSLGDSTIKIFNVQHDNQGPEFENLGDWYFNENITYLKESTEIKLNAFDSLSGLDRIEYRLNSDDEWALYSSDTSLQLFVNGNSDTLFYRAFDKLGNIEEFNETFVLDDDIAEFDFSAVNITFVSTTDNSSNDKKWDGSEIIDYNSYKTLKISLDDISDNGSGLHSILIEYSTDNQSWKEESEIDLNEPSVFIRITIRDNAGNSYTKQISAIEIINIPIGVEDDPEKKLSFIFLILILIAGGSALFYKYKQDQLSGDKDETPKPSPEIKCPNCSVLIPAESKECVFCSSQIDTSTSGILASPFSTSEEKIVKEIKPRTGEILIGPNLDRWKIEVGARSSIGGRTNNEDSISWNSFLRTTNDIPHSIRLGVVADGVGGHNKGEVASSLVISAIGEFVSKEVNNPYNTKFLTPEAHADILEKAYHYANDIVCKKASFEEYSGMATTAVSVYLWEDEGGDNVGFLVGNVGDSRGYFINKKTIKQVTKDDSEVQKLIDSGEITEQEAKTHPRKNVITQAIGNKKILKPRIINYSLKDLEFDSILLCSDGVSDKLGDNEIHKIVNQFDNPQDACNRIIKIINRTNTSHDNITLILIKFPNLHPEG